VDSISASASSGLEAVGGLLPSSHLSPVPGLRARRAGEGEAKATDLLMSPFLSCGGGRATDVIISFFYSYIHIGSLIGKHCVTQFCELKRIPLTQSH
jgi:hypothetical protein